MNQTLKKIIRWALKPVQPYGRRLFGAPAVLLEEMPDSPELFRHYRMLLETGHVRVPGGWKIGADFYPDYITVGGNSLAIQRVALKYCKGKGIDVGANYWPLPGSTPIDIERGPGIANVIEDIAPNSQDYVFSSHCLEHIDEWQKALDVWVSKIRPGGIIFLYLPHPSCKLWHKSNPFMAEVHKWVPDPDTVARALEARGLSTVARDDGPDHFYSFFVCAQRAV
ncbi:MAG TPA: methyltransferase domain-containing protein [Bacteroidota bacterium]|nr:methyltransferase domain-containing protein [Bacteroidota bacterium]